MKKFSAAFLSALLCLSMLLSAPAIQCFADDEPDVPTPYVDESGGDNF